jgi:hypothetical protein
MRWMVCSIGKAMNLEEIDWKALDRMRKAFLEGGGDRSDYWQNEKDLASYDATFAQRIGWKWDYVLEELTRRGWHPPGGQLLDWGCGSGVAHRAFLDHFGPTAASSLHLWDRSSLAINFAKARAKEKYPNLAVHSGVPENPGVAIISHVLTELEPKEVEELADKMAVQASSILWVEPGTYEASLTLIAIRERLRTHMRVVAPCTHQGRCGILDQGNERHWCHHFAHPPSEIFVDLNWALFAKMTGVDLRSLPLSFLVLDKRPVPELPAGATRILGHPRVYKAFALALGSGADGVKEHRITKRRLPKEFRQAKKGMLAPLQIFREDGAEVLEARPLYQKTGDSQE